MDEEKVLDDIYHLLWNVRYVRECPEPHVIERFGKGGCCIVPVVTCNGCRFCRHFVFHGGTQCAYGEEETF